MFVNVGGMVGCVKMAWLTGYPITFPGIQGIREIYKKEDIWSKVKKQLSEEGKLKDCYYEKNY